MSEAVHSPYRAHQFDTTQQQYEAASLGMWAFIIQEILFFGGLIGGYTVYRTKYLHAFIAGSHHLDIHWGAFNTAVLIASSLTMALAVRSAQLGRRTALIGWLIGTIVLGCTFLGVKYIEYSHKYHEHLIPGRSFLWNDPQYPQVTQGQAKIFFSFYFMLTGMHAFHMVVGVGIMLWMIAKAVKRQISTHYFTPIEISGLYWHFVDIVWIFLFPLLYLIGRHH